MFQIQKLTFECKYYICKPSLIFDTFNTFHNPILYIYIIILSIFHFHLVIRIIINTINPRRDSWIISQFPSTRSLNFAPPTTLTCLYFNSFMAVAFYTHPHPVKRITSEQITKRHFVALKIKPRRGLRPRIFLSPLLC